MASKGTVNGKEAGMGRMAVSLSSPCSTSPFRKAAIKGPWASAVPWAVQEIWGRRGEGGPFPLLSSP